MSHLTPQEIRIMDRWEAVRSMQQISRDLALSFATVKRTVTYYDAGNMGRINNAAIVRGSAKLLAAITQARRLAA
ncbi:hypothetical protein [Novosphingobium guangzhouense]|nr:hypothetical protein [Novosphingobium guangzhouense]